MTRSSLGVAATCYLTVWESMDTAEFLRRCHGFGAAGIQAVLRGDLTSIRAQAEAWEMYVEAMVPLPMDGDTAEFEQSLRDAQTVGAQAMRAACLPTRRYEVFRTAAEWRAHVERSYRALEAALPLLDRYKIPLGLENHKDWTTAEFVSLLRRFSSEYLGVCLDFGNNLSLLDLPMETIEALAPYTVSTHLKDVAAAPYEEGVLLSEVVLGRGFIDLRQAVRLIQDARPETRMTLEMITRDPLQIPMLRDEYWASFPEKTASELARTLRFVNERQGRTELPRISHLKPKEIRETEDRNVLACLAAWPEFSD